MGPETSTAPLAPLLPVSAPLGELRVPEFLWGFEPRAPPTLWGSRGVSPHYQFPLPWRSFEWYESSGDSCLQVPGILLGLEARAPPTLWYKFPLPWGSFECQESFGDSSLGRHRPSGGLVASPRTTKFRSPGGASSTRNPLGIEPRAPPTLGGSKGVTLPLPWGRLGGDRSRPGP